VTGPGAFQHFREAEGRLEEVAAALKAKPETVARRVAQLLEEKTELEALLADLRKGEAGGGEEVVSAGMVETAGGSVDFKGVRLRARSPEDVRDWGDGYRGGGVRRVAVVAAELPGGKHTLFAFVSDDLIAQGLRADVLIREVAQLVGGKGGGRPHMAQAGVGDPSALDEALDGGPAILQKLMGEDR
jgi:alanyl-tRNA synthetase